MDRVHRQHVDIRVAYDAAIKRMKAEQVAGAQKQNSASPAAPVPGASARGPRRWLRKPAQLFYRGLLPLARPLAFRLRSYLLDGLMGGMRDIVQQEMRSIYEALRQDVLNGHTWSHEQRQKISLSLLQELQAGHQLLHESLDCQQRKLLESLDCRHRVLLETLLDVANRTGSYADLTPRLERIEAYCYASARRFALNCGDDTVLVRTEAGYLLCAASDQAVLACLVDTGDLERGTRLLIQSILGPGDTFVDVGANVGMHTLAAAWAMQRQGRIYAFEPMPSTANLLARSLWLNNLSTIVTLERAAAFSQSGTRRLFLGASSGHHSLFPLSESPESESTVDVPLVRLDDVLRDVTRVDLIKLDVEGAELDALEGAVETIRRNPDIVLIVELGFSHLHRAGHSVEDWLRRFDDLGLEFRVIDPQTGKLTPMDRSRLEELPSLNLLFARPGARVLMVEPDDSRRGWGG